MERTPDEIKKGLNDPIHVHYHHGDREPHMTPLAMIDLEQLHADALVLIQQLQVENAQLNRCIENMTDKLNAMNDEVAKLQAERDAAVKDIPRACGFCAYYDADEDTCGYQGCCFPVSGVNTAWQWRGAQKEESDA